MDLQKEFDDLKEGQKKLLQSIQRNELFKPEPPLRWLDLNGLSNYLPSKPAHATIYGWLSNGSIPGHKQGHRWIFSVSEIDDWIKEGKQKTLKELEADTDTYLANKNNGLK